MWETKYKFSDISEFFLRKFRTVYLFYGPVFVLGTRFIAIKTENFVGYELVRVFMITILNTEYNEELINLQTMRLFPATYATFYPLVVEYNLMYCFRFATIVIVRSYEFSV